MITTITVIFLTIIWLGLAITKAMNTIEELTEAMNDDTPNRLPILPTADQVRNVSAKEAAAMVVPGWFTPKSASASAADSLMSKGDAMNAEDPIEIRLSRDEWELVLAALRTHVGNTQSATEIVNPNNLVINAMAEIDSVLKYGTPF